ncbi:hypothetical protein EJ110_NYTH46283 [Nymphaea thermarum]|nr:hypothetical protein EJ110_NYTH46283 [Nymphaea thermarum]
MMDSKLVNTPMPQKLSLAESKLNSFFRCKQLVKHATAMDNYVCIPKRASGSWAIGDKLCSLNLTTCRFVYKASHLRLVDSLNKQTWPTITRGSVEPASSHGKVNHGITHAEIYETKDILIIMTNLLLFQPQNSLVFTIRNQQKQDDNMIHHSSKETRNRRRIFCGSDTILKLQAHTKEKKEVRIDVVRHRGAYIHGDEDLSFVKQLECDPSFFR